VIWAICDQIKGEQPGCAGGQSRGRGRMACMSRNGTARGDQEQEQGETQRKPGTWLPGQSGNPAGRPARGLSVQASLARALERKWIVPDGEEQGETRTKLDHLCRAMVDLAIGGSVPAAEWVGNRLEGRVASRVEISGQSEHQIMVVPWLPATEGAIQAARRGGVSLPQSTEVVSDLVGAEVVEEEEQSQE
jgi:hypothetical protein